MALSSSLSQTEREDSPDIGFMSPGNAFSTPVSQIMRDSFPEMLLCLIPLKRVKQEEEIGGTRTAASLKQLKSNDPVATENKEKKTSESSVEKNAYSFSSIVSILRKVGSLSLSSFSSQLEWVIPPQADDISPSIDDPDVRDPLKVTAYAEDIYQFYKDLESAHMLCDYMESQVEINANMRSTLVDWLIQLRYKLELMPETLYLAVYIMDRFLSLEFVPRCDFQVVGVTALLIACKYEEVWVPEVHDFMHVTDNTCSREQILGKEKEILEKLGWNLAVPTPYAFIVRFLEPSSVATDSSEVEKLTFFFAELVLMQYSMVIGHFPSMVAAIVVYAARCTMNKSPLWSEALKRYSGFSEEEVREKALLLMELHRVALESGPNLISIKYSNLNLGSVASFPVTNQLIEGCSSSFSS